MEEKKFARGRPKKGEVRPPKVVKPKTYGLGFERPKMWLIGEDAGSYKHSMYHPWQIAKAQAVYRKEEWLLTFEDFYQLWKDDWPTRGRDSHNTCMTREDPEKPWSVTNTIIVTRGEHLKRLGERRTELKMKYKKTAPVKVKKSNPVTNSGITYKKLKVSK